MKGYHDDIEAATEDNEDFRRVLYTGHNLQLVAMSINPGEELGYDYGKSYFDSFLKPIGCRCPKCMSEKEWQKLKSKMKRKKA